MSGWLGNILGMNIREMTVELSLVLMLAIPIVIVTLSSTIARMGARMTVDMGPFDDSRRRTRWVSWGFFILLLVLMVALPRATFTDRPTPATRNRTSAYFRTIAAALERYRNEYGEYPSPLKESVHLKLDGHDYEAGSALMLYQALTGDGDDKIQTLRGPHLPSDGFVRGDEIKRSFLSEMPVEMWRKTEVGYILVDGYGHPLQFANAGPECVNANYDLWSCCEDVPVPHVDKATKQNENLTRRWIKNW